PALVALTPGESCREKSFGFNETRRLRRRARRRVPAGCSAEARIPEGEEGRSDGHVFRRESRRPLPLARRRELAGDGALGRGGEPAHLRLPGKNPLPAGRQGARRTALQLSQIHRALPPTRILLLLQERPAAKPERALRAEGARRRLGSPARPKQG